MIEVGKYYILSQSEDINDAVIITAVDRGNIHYEHYTTKNLMPYLDGMYNTKRLLPEVAFNKIYKPHPTMNVLYGKK